MLGVDSEESDMSFALSVDNGALPSTPHPPLTGSHCPPPSKSQRTDTSWGNTLLRLADLRPKLTQV